MEPATLISTVLIALFSGAGAALFIEGWYRPHRDRKYVAVLLFHELNQNAQRLDHDRQRRQLDRMVVTSGFSVSTIALEAVKEKLGALPSEPAAWVISTYYGYRHLTDLGLACEDLYREMEREQGVKRPIIDSRMQQWLADYDDYSAQALEDSLRTRDMLTKWAGKQNWATTVRRQSSKN